MNKRDLLLHPTLDEGFKVNFLRRLYVDDKNLILNGGFETPGTGDPDFWADWNEVVGAGVFANEGVIVHKGASACKMTAGVGVSSYLWEEIVVAPEDRFWFRFWTQGDGIYSGRYQVRDQTNAAFIVPLTLTNVTGEAYEMVTVEFTTPTGCIAIRPSLWSAAPNGAVTYFDTCGLWKLN